MNQEPYDYEEYDIEQIQKQEKEGVHEYMDELQLAEYHLKKDALTPDKEMEEMYDDRNGQAFGYDRYRTESMYDSLDRLDMSLHTLMDRRNDQTGRLR